MNKRLRYKNNGRQTNCNKHLFTSYKFLSCPNYLLNIFSFFFFSFFFFSLSFFLGGEGGAGGGCCCCCCCCCCCFCLWHPSLCIFFIFIFNFVRYIVERRYSENVYSCTVLSTKKFPKGFFSFLLDTLIYPQGQHVSVTIAY